MSSPTKTPNKTATRSKLLNHVLQPVRDNSCELTEFNAALELPADHELTLLINALYERDTFESVNMALILEGVITERKPIFLYSGPLCLRYMERKKLERTSYRGSSVKALKKRLCAEGAFMKCLIEPVMGEVGKKNIAGYYTLTDPTITSLLEWWPSPEVIVKLAEEHAQSIGRTIVRTIVGTRMRTTDIDIETESDTEGDHDIEVVTPNHIDNKSALDAPLAVPRNSEASTPAQSRVVTFPSSSPAAPRARAMDPYIRQSLDEIKAKFAAEGFITTVMHGDYEDEGEAIAVVKDQRDVWLANKRMGR
jgi:hypothetical protein